MMVSARKRHGTCIKVAERTTYLLGLDAGNTVIKAVLFDLNGRQVAASALDGQTSTPQPGHVERDLAELWRNTSTVIRDCIEKASINSHQIIGIGCCGHGNGLYLLDKTDEPLLGIQSLDTRGAALAEKLGASGNAQALHRLCLQKPWPSQTATLLAWVKRNTPEIYRQIGTVMLCKDYIVYKLTGRRTTDISDMSGCGLLRLPDCCYDDDLNALYGLPEIRPLLPELLDPTQVIGGVTAEVAETTGLTQGTPVVAGLFDVVACALGSGVVQNAQASIIAGTWSVNQVISAKPLVSEKIFHVSSFGKERFVSIESSATSAANLEWYAREFVERAGFDADPFAYCNQLVSSISPSIDDPVYLPFLYGAAKGAQMRAGYFGMAGWHKEAHMLRAVFEGVVFEHKRHCDQLAAAGIHFDTATLAGGGSRSQVWPQMFSDILEIPVTVAKASETGALGVAIAAAVGIGQYADYEAAVGAMTQSDRHYVPNLSLSGHYAERYKIYSDLSEVLLPLWNRMSRAGLLANDGTTVTNELG